MFLNRGFGTLKIKSLIKLIVNCLHECSKKKYLIPDIQIHDFIILPFLILKNLISLKMTLSILI